LRFSLTAVIVALVFSIAPETHAAAPYLVKDINTTPVSTRSYPDQFVTIGNYVYFTTATKLFRTDGTDAGTIELGPAGSMPVAFNGKAWFTYLGSIWSTDGTVAGTKMLTLPAMTPDIYASVLMPTSNAIYFYNVDNSMFGQLGWIWRTDGTTGGTTQVSSTKLRIATQWSQDYRTWAPVGTSLYFVASDSATSTNWTVWRTDGTTTAIADPLTGQNTFPIALQTFGNVVVFLKTFTNSTGQFWRTDGTPGGSFALTKTQAITYNGLDTNVVISGSYMYFTGNDGTGMKLWRSDGTNAGTTALASSMPGGSATFDAIPLCRLSNGTLLFRSPAIIVPNTTVGLWAFDGTNTTWLANAPDGSARKNATSAGTWALYGIGTQAWRSDGTIGGTYKLDPFLQGASDTHVWPMAALGTNVLFATYDAAGNLRKTDGSAASGNVVKTIYEATESSTPRMLRRLNGGVLFTANDGGGTTDLWFSDGSTAGTQKVLTNAASIREIVPCGTRGYFAYYTGQQEELWVSDGTAAGTAMLVDLYPGTNGSSPNSGSPDNMTCVDNRLYFSASGPDGVALWRSDGTVPGTFAIKTIGANTGFGRPVQFGHGIFFSDGYSLWASNTTPEGTFKVKPGANNVGLSTDVVVAGNYAYVSTTGSPQSLWRSNATVAGTTIVLSDSGFRLLGSFNRRLLFTWSYGAGFSHGYCSMGNAGDTSCFDPTLAGSSVWTTTFKSLNGRLYYNKPNIMSTDLTTTTDTTLSANDLLAVAGGRLYFGGSYQYLKETDGTAAGTSILMTLGSDRPEAAESGGRLFIASDELYAYDLPVTVTSMSPASVPAAGGAVTLTGRGFVAPITVKVGGVAAAVGATSAASIAFTAPAQLAGTYTVTFTNGDGRVVDVDQLLTYSCAAPTAVITGTPGPVCPMVPVHLQGSGAVQCHWYPTTGLDNAASCTPTATLSTTTTYTLVVNNADACLSTNYPTVTVQILPPPDSSIALSDNVIHPSTPYTASVPDAGIGATYSWSATGGLTITSDPAQRTITFQGGCTSGALNVTVTNASGCSSAYTRYVNITLEPQITSVLPDYVHPGTVITISGSYFGCVTSVALTGGFYVLHPPFTIVDANTIRFTFPTNGQQYSEVSLITPPGVQSWGPYGISRSVRDNLNGDLKAEILWRNPGNGFTLIWTLTYDGVISTITPYLRNSGTTDYKIVGMNTFGWSATTDILWQRTSTRELSAMYVHAGLPKGEVVWPAIPSPTLKVAATGDFDGDGMGEILMRDTQSGATSIWKYYGSGSVQQTPVHIGNNLAWTLIAVRDFDFDGKDDVLWRYNPTGQTLLWLMDGATIRASKVINNGGNLDWTIAGVGDFDADGYTDILWRRNSDGLTLLWQLTAGTIRASTVVQWGGNLNMSVAGIGDFDGDGRSDILWRDNNTGLTLYWAMNGPQIVKSVTIHSGNNLEWQIEGPRF